MNGEYREVPYGGKILLFVECPYCGHFTYIPGAKKYHKVHTCWGCDKKFLEGK